ncbi:MAG TPA: CBS domain-containing protein [Gemmatimonadales bacterium]|jgi:CBS domain-containing protein|nr:CBS domain-containing protein [Gemmatimonadales bacterium]
MRVADLMQQPVVTVDTEGTVRDAVVLLSEDHISALPVTDRTGKMVGVVSTSDILTAEAEGAPLGTRDLETMTVAELMTPRPITVSPETDVKEAAQQMLYADVHRLFVTADDRLVGVISTTDIVRAVARGFI